MKQHPDLTLIIIIFLCFFNQFHDNRVGEDNENINSAV